MDRPPFLRTWRNVYALLVIVLITEISLMYCITRYFA